MLEMVGVADEVADTDTDAVDDAVAEAVVELRDRVAHEVYEACVADETIT